MPIEWVVDYYDKAADLILPFFKGRDVDVNQVFDGQNVFRRHEKDGKSWIRINDKERLHFWADWHAWSFYPHLEGDDALWFALDVDPGKCDFECVKIASRALAEILDGMNLKYLIKFSGNRGFHFLWSMGKAPKKLSGEKVWEFERGLIAFLREKLEEKLQKSKDKAKFYKFLKKDDPITIDKSSEKKDHNSILLDKLILHEKANIRSPYSLHEKTKLVSLPIEKNEVMDFKPETEADPNRIQDFKRFLMPTNSFTDIFKSM